MRTFIVTCWVIALQCLVVRGGDCSITYQSGDVQILLTLHLDQQGKGLLELKNGGAQTAAFSSTFWVIKDRNKRFSDFPASFMLQLRKREGEILVADGLLDGWWVPALSSSSRIPDGQINPDNELKKLDLEPGESEKADFDCQATVLRFCEKMSLKPQDIEYRVRFGTVVQCKNDWPMAIGGTTAWQTLTD